MRLAYLVSRYPAVSHTFVLREVRELRSRGFDVRTFSIRRASAADALGTEAQAEAQQTRWLVPPRLSGLLAAAAWCSVTRPRRLLQTGLACVFQRGLSLAQRCLWLCYWIEGIQLAHWLVRDRIDHLHCHFGNSGSHTGQIAARLAGTRFSLTCHGSELLTVPGPQLARKVRHAAFVVCVSHYGRAQLMMVCPPADWPKLHVIRCGVATPRGAGSSWRSPPNPTILCVARLSPEKGHLVLLDAIARLRQNHPDLLCLLVGDGPMRPAIEAAVARLHLADAVRLMGALPFERVSELYPTVSATVLASFSEGVPVVLMEAMAAGCPVVATRVGGVGELVHDAVTGRLVAPGDADALADAIDWTLRNDAEARASAQRARALIEREFCVQASAVRLADLFTSAAERAPFDAAAVPPAPPAARHASITRATVDCPS